MVSTFAAGLISASDLLGELDSNCCYQFNMAVGAPYLSLSVTGKAGEVLPPLNDHKRSVQSSLYLFIQ